MADWLITSHPPKSQWGEVFSKIELHPVSKIKSLNTKDVSFLAVFKCAIIFFFSLCVQLNQYETASNFIQLNQNLAWDCLLI